ncbi:MAG: SDR family oxidoreductase [Dehalococcoidia bacterium]|nr:MAG: SDR family oxidoreductase [Dehalococcoidia bacterium]
MENAQAPLLGKVALVTGAAGAGIGHATALALARAGADIVVNTHRSRDAAEVVAEEVRGFGRRALVVVGDVSAPDEVDRLFAAVRPALGEPSIVIVSAGALWKPRPLDAIPSDEWKTALAEEVDALYLLARASLPAMRSAGWGRIAAVGGFDSEDWRIPTEDGPIDYALGKAARHWLIRTLARQEGGTGITVNGVAPGPITRVPVEDLVDAVKGAHALDGYRRPTQVDVAETLVWLVTQPAVNGAIVPLPGPEPGAVKA